VKILAIDPGTRLMGYAVMTRNGRTIGLADYGTFAPDGLRSIFRKVADLVRRARPQAVVLERAFLAKNPRTFERLVEARAAVMLAAEDRPVHHYTPSEVKRAVARWGRASKSQIQRVVRELFVLKRTPPPDAADAIALGFCHLIS
jgi:crossover junction endodeoxyribonuclease RuvC